MATSEPGGSTAFDRLARRYDTVCPACGHEDDRGTWQVLGDGARVQYRHTCPVCGAVETRNIRLD